MGRFTVVFDDTTGEVIKVKGKNGQKVEGIDKNDTQKVNQARAKHGDKAIKRTDEVTIEMIHKNPICEIVIGGILYIWC